MFKLVVLSALVAVALAKPGHLGGALAYSSFSAPSIAIPSAVSHSYRTDVVSKPLVATYAAPVVQKTFVAAPVHAVPSAVSHSYRTDVVSKPVITAYAAPAVVAAPILTAPAFTIPSAVSHSYRTDVVSKPIVATYATQAVVSTPLVHKTIVAAPAVHYSVASPVSYAAHVPSVHAW